jgi:nicotinamidase-related amidase
MKEPEMSHTKTALIVIDAQESFRHMPYWSEDGYTAYIERQQALVDGARRAGVPRVQIFHTRPGSPFDRNGDYVRTLAELDIHPDAAFYKERHSALAGTGLDIWLTRNHIGRLIISGIRTEQCCETTTRNASDMGYEVDFVSEATFTFAMKHASGEIFSADAIKTRTELVLDGRFARIATVEQALADLSLKAAA